MPVIVTPEDALKMPLHFPPQLLPGTHLASSTLQVTLAGSTTSVSLSLTFLSGLTPATPASESGSTSPWRTSARHRSAASHGIHHSR